MSVEQGNSTEADTVDIALGVLAFQFQIIKWLMRTQLRLVLFPQTRRYVDIGVFPAGFAKCLFGCEPLAGFAVTRDQSEAEIGVLFPVPIR